MNKIKTLFLILIMLFFPLNVNAEETSGTIENVNWNYEDGVLTLRTENDTYGYAIQKVPYGQNAINGWYIYKDDIKKIIVEDGIDIIVNDAFKEYSNLEEVVLPKSMGGYIGDYAFYNCSKLKSIKISDGLSRIGDYAFYGTSISEVELPIYLDWTYEHSFNENTEIKRPDEYEELISAGTAGKIKGAWDSFGNGTSNNNTCYNKFYYSSFFDDTSYWKLYKDGTLVVFGSQLTNGYAGSRQPWGCYKKEIKKMIFNDDKTGTIDVDNSVCNTIEHVKLTIYASKSVEDIMQNRIRELKGNYIHDCREDCYDASFNIEEIVLNRGIEKVDSSFWNSQSPTKDKSIYFNKYVKTINEPSIFLTNNEDRSKVTLHFEISPEDYTNNDYSYNIFGSSNQQPLINDGKFITDPVFSNNVYYKGSIVNDIDDTYVSINDTSAPDTIEIEGKTYYKYETYLTNLDGIANISIPNDDSIDYYVKIIDDQNQCLNVENVYKINLLGKNISEVLEIKDTNSINVPDTLKNNNITKIFVIVLITILSSGIVMVLYKNKGFRK